MEKEMEYQLNLLYKDMGIDTPENHDKILEFCMNDIKETADDDWNSEDVRIAFRRFIESKT